MRRHYTLTLSIALLCQIMAYAQRPVLMHSHNDYCRTAPFYEAYSQKASSIEADVFYIDGELLVGHDLEDLRPDMNFREMYVEPVVRMFHLNGGRAWKDTSAPLQLMVELKSDTEPELSAVIDLLSQYHDVFNPHAVRVVITGNVPSPNDFSKYPEFITFDGDFNTGYTTDQLRRIALFSTDFGAISKWNGKGNIPSGDLSHINALIDKAHGMGKPIRFWNAPESTDTYQAFLDLGIDYINTDKPAVCAAFYNDDKGDYSCDRQTYKNTNVKNIFVAENPYRTLSPTTIEPRSWDEARKILPAPYWDGHQDEVDMYWHAWQIAVGNIRQPQEGSGFVSPYLDVAYNGNIFMWDDSFMMLFARYGHRFFPFQGTLDNFYARQHQDGFICREIRADGTDCFERYDPTSTGPNLLPWAELMYYRQFGDLDRLHRVFPALAAYANWWRLNRTWPDGTYWTSGWGTGMDNLPRVPAGYNQIFSNGHMSWLDANLQQLLIDWAILQIGFYTERWQEVEDMEDEMKHLKSFINDKMWDDETGFLYDVFADGSRGTAKTIAAFWALHTDALDKTRLDRLVEHLKDTTEFARSHRVPSLSADHRKYNPLGRYWQGGVWPNTDYMIIDGLWNKGYRDLAMEIARNHYGNVLKVWKDTGTFWEYYAPESAEPGFMARRDFVGWTGLPPIAVFIEYILGIHSDFSEGTIEWNIHHTDAHGIERLPFGPDGTVSLKVARRTSSSKAPELSIKTDVPFDLIVNWGEGKTSRIHITKNTNIQLK